MEINTENLRASLISFALEILETLPERPRDIVVKRFGIEGEKAKTLEEIGQEYQISRERIRQIEKGTLRKLKEIKRGINNKSVSDSLCQIVERYGGVIGEQKFVEIILGEKAENKIGEESNKNNYSTKGALFLALELDNELNKLRENACFKKRLVYSKEGLKEQDDFINDLTGLFRSDKKMLSSAEILSLFRNKNKKNFPADLEEVEEKEILFSYLDPSKLIEQNYFGQWGLVSWPEVKPRSIKDKIYLALKKSGQPLHFKEIAKLINEICQDKRLAKHQTVHNELIKDGRCVLIGRGIYALKEWGYQSGIVKEVIVEVIRESDKPMKQSEIIAEVLKRRLVKRNTIMVNLKNNECFVKAGDGGYKLKY